ncbi:enolase-phosphatase E1 [Sorochytrium milnesiophthora]
MTQVPATTQNGSSDDHGEGQEASSLPTRAFELDDLVHLEDMFVDMGREEGIAAGAKAGVVEGRLMGIEKAFEMTSEVGFYHGYASLWKETLIPRAPSAVSPRCAKAIDSLLVLLESWPLENTPTTGMLELLERIRGKWKHVQVLLKDVAAPPSPSSTATASNAKPGNGTGVTSAQLSF